TGDPGRGGWATPGGIEGRPGQVGLYYKVLEKSPQEQAALTVAHELSHYVYALPDEYQDGEPQGLCPLSNPTGPGCLMDNYFLRRGDYGRYCDTDHNAIAPNPNTLAHEHTQQQSCKFWVDRFFQLRPPASTDSSEEVKADTASISSEQPFTGRFRSLVNSATTVARAEIKRLNIGINRRTVDPDENDRDRVKNIARRFLDAQLKVFGSDPDFVKPTSSQKSSALDIIARNAFIDPVGGLIEATTVLGQDVINKLKVKARELASEESAKIPGSSSLIQNLLSSDRSSRDRLKKFQPTIDRIKKTLLAFLKGPGGGFQVASAPGPNALGPQEVRLVEKIAREAVLGTADASSFATLSEAAKLHIRLSLVTAQNLIDVSSDLDVPGVENRNQELKQYSEQLSKYALPGRTFAGFGRRRTLILAPPPLYPNKDIVRIDAGDSMPYERIRLLVISQLTKLIERERIEEIEQRLPDVLGKLSSGERFRVFNKMVNATTEYVRRNRAENIILISPPGGLPTELSDELEGLRARIQRNGDVRLDVIEMFDGDIPLRLRDEVYQSGGTVQFTADIDELGAIAQRLKNDISAGSWVTYPELGTIDLNLASAINPGRAGRTEVLAPNYWRDIVTRFAGEPDKPRDGLLSEFKMEINDELLGTFDFISENLLKKEAKPSDFENVKSFYSALYKLMSQLETTRSVLKDLRLGNPAEPTERALKEVRAAKETIHSIFWKSGQEEAFLARTDDALDGQLRDTVRERARKLEIWAKQNEEGSHKLDELIKGQDEKPQVEKPQDTKPQDTKQPDIMQSDNLVFLKYFASKSRWSSLRLYSRAASLYMAMAEYDRETRDLQRNLDQQIAYVRTAAKVLKTKQLQERMLDEELKRRQTLHELAGLILYFRALLSAIASSGGVGEPGTGAEVLYATASSGGVGAPGTGAEVVKDQPGAAHNPAAKTDTQKAANPPGTAPPPAAKGDPQQRAESVNKAPTSPRFPIQDQSFSEPKLSTMLRDMKNRIEALNHEILIREAKIEEIRKSLSQTSVARVFDVQVSPNDLVSAAENLVHFIQLILDIHKNDDSETFTDHLYYDHELITAVDSLERAAENKPDPHRFAVAVQSLQALIQNIQSVKRRDGDPPLDKDLFGIEANRIRKRSDDLGTRSKDLLRVPSPRSLSISPSAGSRTTPLENPISTLVNLYSSQGKTLLSTYSKFGGGGYAFINGEYIFTPVSPLSIPNIVIEPLGRKRTNDLYDLFGQIETSNKCVRRYVSSLRASREAVQLDLGDRFISPLRYNLSPKVLIFLNETTVHQDRNTKEVNDLLTDWIEQWVYEIYPLTLHNIHEELRDLDQKLSKLAQTDVFQRPVFERLKDARQLAVVKVPPSGNGKMVEVEFKPFQAEEGADYELVLGLSRPLNDFEKLRSNVEENPEIHLY